MHCHNTLYCSKESTAKGAASYHEPVEEGRSDARPGAEDAELGVLHAYTEALAQRTPLLRLSLQSVCCWLAPSQMQPFL